MWNETDDQVLCYTDGSCYGNKLHMWKFTLAKYIKENIYLFPVMVS